MRKLFILLVLIIPLNVVGQKRLFGKIPEFLTESQEIELNKAFSSASFIRFSSTFSNRVIIAYENSSVLKKGSLKEIHEQIFKMNNKLLMAKKEKPKVSKSNWIDYKERIEVYPSGVIAVFRNKQLSHVWLDF